MIIFFTLLSELKGGSIHTYSICDITIKAGRASFLKLKLFNRNFTVPLKNILFLNYSITIPKSIFLLFANMPKMPKDIKKRRPDMKTALSN